MNSRITRNELTVVQVVQQLLGLYATLTSLSALLLLFSVTFSHLPVSLPMSLGVRCVLCASNASGWSPAAEQFLPLFESKSRPICIHTLKIIVGHFVFKLLIFDHVHSHKLNRDVKITPRGNIVVPESVFRVLTGPRNFL